MYNQLTFFKQKYRIIYLLLSLFLVGCAADPLNLASKSKSSYKSSKNSALSFKSKTGYHKVKPGETLYSIAFKYGLDYKKVASLNNIPVPYVIYPNQTIRVSNSVKKVTKPTAKTSNKRQTKQVANTSKKSSKQVAKSVKKTTKKRTYRTAKSSGKPLKWVWPVNGKTLKGFSNKGVSSKGIDIKGRINDKVLSAADGIVVYAGNGLIGYGNLVIVKHNEEYLSAYAHNQQILVKEKQSVKAGQQLAIIGSKGKEQSLLHFEVRKDGQPIDPLTVLPKTR